MRWYFKILVVLAVLGMIAGLAYWEAKRWEVPIRIQKKQEMVREVLSNSTIQRLRNSTWGRAIDFDIRGRPDWLLYWTGKYLKYADPNSPHDYDPSNMQLNALRNRPDHYDPLVILEYGVGRCEEFSIVYASFLKAAGYNVRLVYDYSTGAGNGDHVWVEVDWLPLPASVEKLGQKAKQGFYWTHIDPTEGAIEAVRISENLELRGSETFMENKFIDDPEMYERDWGKDLNNVWAIHPDYSVKVTEDYQWETVTNE